MRRVPLKNVIKLLSADIGPVFSSGPVQRMVTMEIPPLFPIVPPDYVINGTGVIDYRECITPPVGLPLMQVVSLLETLVKEEKFEISNKVSQRFVGTNPARLMAWATGHKDIHIDDLVLDDKSGVFMITGDVTFGIDEHHFVCHDTLIPHNGEPNDLVRDLFVGTTTRSRHQTMNAMYRRAGDLGRKDAMDMIAILYYYQHFTYDPKVIRRRFNYGRLNRTQRKNIELMDKTFAACLDHLYHHPDPLGMIFKEMVPDVISRRAFQEAFGDLKNRIRNPDQKARGLLERKVAKMLGFIDKAVDR